MGKTKLMPFDIEKAKKGAKVVTRHGHPVRIGFYDIKGSSFPIVCAVKEEDNTEVVRTFTKEGYHNSSLDIKSDYDLFIEEEEEETDYNPYKDDVTPKFKVGDWIVQNNAIYKVTEICTSWYEVIDTYEESHYSISFDQESMCHLWDINDAKDGDVLCYETKDEFRIFIYKKGHIYFHCHYYNGHLTTVDSYFVIPKHLLCYIHPATQEQRDLLFQKMKEEGYEWDPNKKELKNIENEATGNVKKEVKTRKMTRQELSDWLLNCPEEHREWKYKGGSNLVFTLDSYHEDDASEAVETKLIRRNHGEWQEPLVEI